MAGRSGSNRLTLLRSVYASARVGSVVLLVLTVVQAFVPLGQMFAIGALIGAIVRAVQNQPIAISMSVLLPLAGIAVLFLLAGMLSQAHSLVLQRVASRLHLTLRDSAMVAAASPAGIAHLEDPPFVERLEQAREPLASSFVPGSLLSAMCEKIGYRLRGAGGVIIVSTFRWWAGPLLALAWALQARWLRKNSATQVTRMEAGTSDLQRSRYFRHLSLRPPAAKEVRIFGLHDWLVDRFSGHWEAGMSGVWETRSRSTSSLLPASLAIGAANAVVLFLLMDAAFAGTLGLGLWAVYVQAAIQTRELGDFMARWGRATIGSAGALRALELPEVTRTPHSDLHGTLSADGLPRSAIFLEDVTFSYPGAEARVIDGLSLTIRAGRSHAVVGANGAGKTTLVKLLCRLYDPDAGIIRVDDSDLAGLSPAAWAKQLAVIFQDFLMFEMSVRDNIAMGCLEFRDDMDRLRRAAEAADALKIIEDLPNGWDTILSKSYEGGTDLSGGQWQRIALARALFAVEGGAKVLILDEPTANLDVRAEAALFDRFLDLTAGLTTILISHRFSTVRHVDHIFVIEDGRLVEEGSHPELITLGGRYARMFSIQAERFSSDA